MDNLDILKILNVLIVIYVKIIVMKYVIVFFPLYFIDVKYSLFLVKDVKYVDAKKKSINRIIIIINTKKLMILKKKIKLKKGN